MGPSKGARPHSVPQVNLTDPGELKSLLLRHGLAPTKRWGQHFLVSPTVVDRILEAAGHPKGVLEIGPGPGVLTRPLSERCERVIAYEVDPIAVSALSESAPRAEIRHEDALRVDLGIALMELPEPRAVVSNMPYNITAPLLQAFAGVRRHYETAVLMMQLEVGRRLLAQAGDSNAGSLSIFMQAQFEIEKVCLVPPGAFYPPPNVDSIVLKLTPRETGIQDEAAFFGMVRTGFTQPRKTLVNNLSPFGKERVLAALASGGFTPSVRPHQLSLDNWKSLAASIIESA